MHKDFVYLNDIAPEIITDIRYATTNNFTGKVVIGYEKEVCIITLKAANILKQINSELNQLSVLMNSVPPLLTKSVPVKKR